VESRGASASGDTTASIASPLARRVAAATGVNLATVRGTGSRGRILRRDVEATAAQHAPCDDNASKELPVPAIEFRHAIRDALDEELARDDRVVLFGEDVAAPGGVFAVTPGLQERHGADRVFDTPIAELAIAGAAFGSSVCGLRPVIEIMFGDFMPLAMDALVNQAAKYFYLSNEQASVPLVVRSAIGAGGRFGAIHSQSPITWFLGVPGLKIVTPATPSDAKTLLISAIRDDNPVLFLEHKRLYSLKEELEHVDSTLGRATVRRRGADVTLVSVMKGVHDCPAAAETLAADGIDAEVLDLRTLRPMDNE
jgi:pyruvate/2-oxoglutarate/acetoin dehydrogenase E1 component